MTILLENPITAEKTTVYTHLVTLIKRSTGEEVSFTVDTLSDGFCEVLREITHQRVARRLNGYEIFEALPCHAPF